MMRWIFLGTLISLWVFGIVSSKENTYPNSHLCTRIERFEKSFTIPKTKRIKESYKGLCASFRLFCTKYRWKTIDVFEDITLNETRVAYDCCKGYEKKDGACIPVCSLGCGHGECVEPETCHCDAGWRTPLCTEECEPNRYGKNCFSNCTCENGGICNKVDGTCACLEGYEGKYCESPCPNNTYGLNCSERCLCKNGAMCDIKDGTCDCQPGYYGEYCEKTCEPGNHGENCLYECECIPESTASCSHIDGECICLPGYKGQFCEQECDNFTYGEGCKSNCSCENAKFCHHVSGNCICKPGWIGKRCSEICPPGKFGEDCMFTCDKCANETTICNHVDGSCDCPLGSYGEMCEKGYPGGYWGTNCKIQSNCSSIENCSNTTDGCICASGWMGPNCSEPCNAGWYGFNCSSECNCSSLDSCNAATGSCHNPSQVNSLTNLILKWGIPSCVVALCCVFIILSCIYYPKVLSVPRISYSKRASQDHSSMEGIINIGTITAEASIQQRKLPDNFMNPLYSYGFNEDPSKVDMDVQKRFSIQAVTDFDIAGNNRRSSGNSYEDVPLEIEENHGSSEIENDSRIEKVKIGCFARNSKRDSKRICDASSESIYSSIGREKDFAPAELCDFKIPEDDTPSESTITFTNSLRNLHEDIARAFSANNEEVKRESA